MSIKLHGGLSAGISPAAAPALASAPAASFEGLPPAAKLAGVSAMATSKASAVVLSLCQQHSWPLSLDPGQNQFTIEVTAPQVCFVFEYGACFNYY